MLFGEFCTRGVGYVRTDWPLWEVDEHVVRTRKTVLKIISFFYNVVESYFSYSIFCFVLDLMYSSYKQDIVINETQLTNKNI